MGEFNRDEGLGNDNDVLEIQRCCTNWRSGGSVQRIDKVRRRLWTLEQIANGEAELRALRAKAT